LDIVTEIAGFTDCRFLPMRTKTRFIWMRGRGCRWHGSDIEWGIDLISGIWLAGLKPSAYTASASIYGALASGVARETRVKLVVAALGDVPISEDEGGRGDWKRRPLAPLLQSLAPAV